MVSCSDGSSVTYLTTLHALLPLANFLLVLWLDSLIWAWASSFRRGFMITHFRHTTVGRTPLDEGPARSRDLYLTSHNTHKRQTSMPPVGFESTILVSEWPKTHALDRTATGIGTSKPYRYIMLSSTKNIGFVINSVFEKKNNFFSSCVNTKFSITTVRRMQMHEPQAVYRELFIAFTNVRHCMTTAICLT
jgi:hypothetical protein